MSENLTHLNAQGDVHMVDVGDKDASHRMAIAHGSVRLGRRAFECLNDGRVEKGNVLATARVAGIMAAKKTSELIPLCHQILLSKVEISIELNPIQHRAIIFAEVQTQSQTGVEMEALTAVSATALTIYDMLKAVDRSITIEHVQLVEKNGGKSGHYRRPIKVERQSQEFGEHTEIPKPKAPEPHPEEIRVAKGSKTKVPSKNRDLPAFTIEGLDEYASECKSLDGDSDQLKNFLIKSPVRSAYMLGDLDPAYQHACLWHGRVKKGIEGLALLYSALSVPAFLTEGDSTSVAAIINTMRDTIPRRVYYQIHSEHLPAMNTFFQLSDRKRMLRMGLTKAENPPCKLDDEVVVLSHRDTGDIMKLYQHYPDNFFDPSMLNTGLYFGIRIDGSLQSVAGIHFISESNNIAAVGNIVTSPDARGKGYASRCVSHLVTKLLERVDIIALNVEIDNHAAIKCYEGVGFKECMEFEEGWATKHSHVPGPLDAS